ncbi:MAG: sugar transferase [Saprospiraceae bacterium]|nr:sugar transferase [Saprospiraceae bacterium]
MYSVLKRGFDILSSFIMLVLLLPLLLLIIIILKLTGEGEIFYLQKRVGKEGKSFGMLKFATMLKNSPNMDLGTITTVNDPRVTIVGKYLRKTKLNELPQIINVLKGDISVVGPRPLPENEYIQYKEEVRSAISKIRPGITGIGSLVFRDEETILFKNNTNDPRWFYEKKILPYKGELEIWYTKNMGFIVDLKLLFITFFAIVLPRRNPVFNFFNDLPAVPAELVLR